MIDRNATCLMSLPSTSVRVPITWASSASPYLFVRTVLCTSSPTGRINAGWRDPPVSVRQVEKTVALFDVDYLRIETRFLESMVANPLGPPVEPTPDNPYGNPPVTCVHCSSPVRWPDRESCEMCGGFTCGCRCTGH